MRVVVTGATGNLGTAVLGHLAADPTVDEVVGVARRPPRPDDTGVDWVATDLSVTDAGPILRGADAVVHLAWSFQPTHDPLTTWAVNVRGGVAVAEATAAEGVPTLVHASSVGAYRAVPEPRRVGESWHTDALPTAAYGREKSYLERVLDGIEARHPGTRVVRLRPAFVFHRQAAAAQRRIFAGPLLARSLLRARIPLVPVPAGLRLQTVHADDVARAVLQALHRDVHGAFNLAAEPVLGGAQLAAALGGRPVEIPMRAVRAAVALGWHSRLLPASPQLLDLVAGLPLLDTSRARDELGWTPTVDALDALDELLEGLRRGAHGSTPALSDDAPGRWDEIRTGVGARSTPPGETGR